MKNLSADIVVIGGGTAGLPAALTAAQGGAKVILFEKKGITGGAGSRANQVLGIESRLQKLHPPVTTKEHAFKFHMDWTHWRVDSNLVRAFYDKAGSTIDWLEEQGVEFSLMSGPPGAPKGDGKATKSPPPPPQEPGMNFNTPHQVVAPPQPNKHNINITWGAGSHLMKVLTERCREAGVQLMLKTPVKKIIKRGGRVTGVIAEDSSGTEIKVDAKAVIIATGGFGDNPAMIKQYLGYEEGKDLFMIKVLGVKGDGIRMAWEAGAATSDMHVQLMHHLAPPCQGGGGTTPELRAFARPYNIMVNIQGKRFVPEDLHGGHQSVGNIISIQKDRAAFMIFDGETKKFYDRSKEEIFSDAGQSRPTLFKHDNLDDNIKDIQEYGYKWVYVADSIKELCEQTGIDPEGLQKTVAEYNKFCEEGHDDQFNKDPQYLRTFKKPRFYAARFFPGGYGTVGGIKINEKIEVLDKDDKAIPGLYATGNDSNCLYDVCYITLAANYMGFAVNSGRMAAENALEYIKRN
jgi:fumarate reductase flavoprotein subunit